MGSCEEGYKKTEDPKFVEDFLTSPDHISFSLLLLLLLILAMPQKDLFGLKRAPSFES